ncbi:MAG: beta-hydroxyacyl-ACP dehydratase [Bacteriovoracaceae bacterium]|jgi:3-hydroxyacyl-[acyl-carrier-protein] dehydratase|nr:beta-hydroxyacyl-ACP dehydratase [Bacteriovoracaceae bacterium]
MEEILARIPQRDPFLFIEKIVDRTENSVTTSKLITGKEDFFKGHFPGDPIMPGVLLSEAAFQTGALLMSYIMEGGITGKTAVVSRIKSAKFKKIVRPGDEIIIEVKLDEQIDNTAFLKGNIKVDGKTCVQINFACSLVG